MTNKYTKEHAEIDAELLLEGPLCRVNYSAATRDKIATHLLRLVARETSRGVIVRSRRFKNNKLSNEKKGE